VTPLAGELTEAHHAHEEAYESLDAAIEASCEVAS
jgi:hypothetical protein